MTLSKDPSDVRFWHEPEAPEHNQVGPLMQVLRT
jgi:hypothetical protein